MLKCRWIAAPRPIDDAACVGNDVFSVCLPDGFAVRLMGLWEPPAGVIGLQRRGSGALLIWTLVLCVRGAFFDGSAPGTGVGAGLAFGGSAAEAASFPEPIVDQLHGFAGAVAGEVGFDEWVAIFA